MGGMPTYIVEYTYGENSHLRDAHRPEHRAYLSSLVQTGKMVAFGRWDDVDAPGALLIFEAADEAEVDALVARDPFVMQGLVPFKRTRRWAGTWGALPSPAS